MEDMSVTTQACETPALFELLPRDTKLFDVQMLQVPERYRWAKVRELKPNKRVRLTPERQQQVIAILRKLFDEEPTKSVMLYGPPGTGKTTLMAAIFRRAAACATYVRAGHLAESLPRLFWAEMGDWQQKAVAYKFGRRANAPKLNTDDLVSAAHMGFQPMLFLDEFDKVSNAEHERPVLDALLRAAYDSKARIVMTTNCRRDEFQARFDDHIYRRLDEDAAHIDLFIGAI
jgi:predicted ATPase